MEGDSDRINQAFATWPDADQAICSLAATTVNGAQAFRLEALASIANNDQGCDAVSTTVVPEEDEGTSPVVFLLVFGLLALLGLVIAAIFMVWQRRGNLLSTTERVVATSAPETASAEAVDFAEEVTPIARFETTYVRGHDTYDDSFSIENIDGDFLGECGVGLSDTIGTDMPKSVTAFEVWLFDKNDIRTVTKVVMSDHAFFDDAIKAKLAPKGEPVLARPNETIVLETASLIVNADITEMEYGSGTQPPQSFFERFTVELSAWAKHGDYGEPDTLESDDEINERVDEMLEF